MPYPVVSWTARHAERAQVETALVQALTVGGSAPIRFFDGVLLVRDTTRGSVGRAAAAVDGVMQTFDSGRALVVPGRQGSVSECWAAVADRNAAVPFVNISAGAGTFPRQADVRPRPPIGGTTP